MNRQQAIELARKIKDIRKKRLFGGSKELSLQTLLKLREMGWPRRQMLMERLVKEGYADSIEAIERMLKGKKVCLSVGTSGSATESKGMSDDILDAGVQYLDINKEIL